MGLGVVVVEVLGDSDGGVVAVVAGVAVGLGGVGSWCGGGGLGVYRKAGT